ncbi:MAG: DUF1800 family protein, partial [Prosthecobacter sp.]|nr:DUF1800 family protein [Prosthecobacter sp.]
PLAGAAPVETGSITVTRGGPIKLGTLVVPLQKLGTASEGTDYDSLPTELTFAPGVGEVVLPINPKANSSRRTNVTAIVQALASGTGGYVLGAASSGGVVINPAGIANGTGLTGEYFNSSSTVRATQAAIFGGSTGGPHMTRTDATIDFNGIASIAIANPCVVTMVAPHGLSNGASVTIRDVSGGSFSPTINATFIVSNVTSTTFTVPSNCTAVPSSLLTAAASGINGWGATGGPTGMSPASATTAFSVRWTGQILPQYSETYNFDIRSDDSVRLWINGQLIIDNWVAQSLTDAVNSVNLVGGILYDIKIEYFNNTSSTAPQTRLYWWSTGQVKQIVPQNRLFPSLPAANKTTAVTSTLAAVGYEGTPFRFSVTSSNIGTGTLYSLDAASSPLPPGLSLNTATGVISGTPTQAGVYNIAVNAQNVDAGATTGSSIVNITIYPTGSVSREILTATGNNVSDIVVPINTTEESQISTVDDDTDHNTRIGKRLRGYLVPPKTGNYYFWLAASSAAELWISNDAEYANRVLRASVIAGTGKKTWNASPSQQSPWLALQAGQKYYFEVLHNTGPGSADDDHVAVGWCQDDVGTIPAVIGAPNATGVTPIIPNGGAALQGYPLSGTVPGYIFQPYDYPQVTPPDGELYAANLGPQGNVTTSASGSVNLRVNAAGTQAILHFDFQNLGSPRTAYHLHVDGYVDPVAPFNTHPQGDIIFDIDDADGFPPELRTEDGGYIWDLAAVGSFVDAGQVLRAIQLGKVYLNVHSVVYPNGEIRGTLNLIDGSQTPPQPAQYPEPTPTDVASADADAARFLNQATFGAGPTDLAFVKANGFSAWIDDQLTKTPSHTSDDVVAGLTADINQPYPATLFTNTWWKNVITKDDQLRQRLAFALSEILVVSWQNNTGPLQYNGRALADYYDQLVDRCLPQAGLTDGTFRDILKSVTLTPAMGLYLDMRANQKGDDTIGRHPNENYAREIMQLFSIGIYRNWDDGKYVLEADAGLVPTYTQPTIIGLSNLLTGWNYAQANQANGRLPTNFGPGADYLNPMVLVPSRHELGAKLLLNNVVSPPATGLTPRVPLSTGGITIGNPCTINVGTSSAPAIHGLSVGDTIRIANVTGGTFTTPINAAHEVIEIVDADSFKINVGCSVIPTAFTNAVVTGAKVTPIAYGTGGIAVVTGSQADSAGTGANHPYDMYGLNELELAINNIVGNDNVAPYICRQLIQRLVTSDPSPGYLYRVVQKFRNNGSGVRGDMAAVVRQILLDGEARRSTSTQTSPTFGKQREPMLRLAGPARAFPAANYTGTYTQLTGTSSYRLRIITSAINDFSTSFPVSLNFRGNYITTSPPDPFNNPTTTTYTVQRVLGISSIATGSPCTITTPDVHGLQVGDVVTISGVSGGTYTNGTINSTLTVTAVPTTTTFQTAVNCITAPSSVSSAQIVGANTMEVNDPSLIWPSYSQTAGSNTLTVTTNGPQTNVVVPGTNINFSSIATGSPCTVTTTAAHGLSTGQIVNIVSVDGGTFSPSINSTYTVTVTDGTHFTVPVNCTLAPDPLTGSALKTIKSKVYLDFLSGATMPADGVYTVQTNGSGNFTVTVADTTARSGLVMIPRVASSYTPMTGNTIVQYNTNTNHALVANDQVWVDAPVVNTTPVRDAEYTVNLVTDEDHFRTSSQPTSTNGGVYTNPAGSSNSVTLWPLKAPPTGRSGSVTINQSTFNLGSTEGSLTQSPLNAPTVFNYFFPDYKFPGLVDQDGNSLDSPEFQLTTDTNVMNLTNNLTNTFIGTGGGNGNLNGLCSFSNGNGSVVMDLGPYMTNAKTNEAGIPGLVDELASLLVGAPLETATRTAIIAFVNHKNGSNVLDYLPYTTPTNLQKRDRVRAVIHLIITSAEYAVQK